MLLLLTLVISKENEITIFNVSRHINHRYECIASNGCPPDVARTFHLTIQYSPEIKLYINKELLSDILFINLNSNKIHLKCQVLMNPLDKVYWMKNNKIFNYNYQIYHIENYIILELIINNFTDYDQGQYTCIASNLMGMNSKSIHLFALSTTTITVKRKYSQYIRSTTTTVSYSRENLRIITFSSTSKLKIIFLHNYHYFLYFRC